jgi:hypothetical protein
MLIFWYIYIKLYEQKEVFTINNDFEKCLAMLRKDKRIEELLKIHNEKEKELSALQKAFNMDTSFQGNFYLDDDTKDFE